MEFELEEDKTSLRRRARMTVIATNRISCRRNTRDLWVWSEEANENYSVKIAYNDIQNVTNVQESEVFKKLWSLKVSPFALHFCWKTLLGRISTKENLKKRGIALNSNLCPLFIGTKCLGKM